MTSKDLTLEEKKIANDFVKAYDKCIKNCQTTIKLCEDTDKYLFALEEETKNKKPFKLFKKNYKKWESLMNLIHQQQEANNTRYMEFLRELEELIEIRLDLKTNN